MSNLDGCVSGSEIHKRLSRFSRQTTLIVVHELPATHPCPPVTERAMEVFVDLAQQVGQPH